MEKEKKEVGSKWEMHPMYYQALHPPKWKKNLAELSKTIEYMEYA